MTRYLTPSKIALLALIELYTDATVPTSSTIPILSFLLNQLLPSTVPRFQPEASTLVQPLPFILEPNAFETLLAAYPAAHGLPGRTLWDHFLKKLWDIDSLDALHIFFEKRVHLLAKPHDEAKRDADMGIPPPSQSMIILSRTSPFGSFVRRAIVEFERLRFSDAVSLWMTFVKWRQDTRIYWLRRNGGGLSRWAGDNALLDGQLEWGVEETEMLQIIAYGNLNIDDADEGCLSTDDIEKVLEFQVEQMQSKLSTSKSPGTGLTKLELGSRIPVEIKDKFKNLLDQSVMIPSLSHYLQYGSLDVVKTELTRT